ncbi:MAG: ribosome biogenesis GTPase Der [Chlamydiota bacterium]|nr:ribosome biogenesis GTPase Der [Chlamydiota bacterium]
MSKLLKLAIVGRPNVGKSALFNRICKQRIAIVDEAEGVTRDRLYAESEIFGRPFEVIDTGGINPRSPALFNEEIKRQAEIAIEEADTIVMVVDSQIGVTDLDIDLARILLKTDKPLCLAVNKVDNYDNEHVIYDFGRLGIKNKIAVSAAQNWQLAELLEAAFEDFPAHAESSVEETKGYKVAIIGRPNVGKSSLINYLLNDNRCIVSPIPGTTRDSVDIGFTQGDDEYIFIDTAGIRRKGAEHEVVDKFAAIRTQRAIERSDVCLLMLDSTQGMTTQEKKIANMIEEAGKGCIILFNKWDLVEGFRMEHCMKNIEEEVPFLKHCPKIFMSVKEGRNINKIFDLIKDVKQNSLMRISTHQLNKFVGRAIQINHPPLITGKRLRIYYMAQVAVNPPKFVIFVNRSTLMTDTYKKYLYNQFRKEYRFTGVPINIHLRDKAKTKDRRTSAPDRSLEDRDYLKELEEAYPDE